MKKRLEKIKQADRKAYYELANEIGISEYSLYNYMTKGEYSLNTEEKIKKYLKKYKTKDEQIKQWKHEYEVLDACCELAQGKIAELKAENELLREENLEEQKQYTEVVLANAQKIRQLRQTLQKIKGVVTALYMNNWLQMNETARKSIQLLHELITKAEEE